MVTRVAINGFGRIGRNVFKVIESRDDIEVVAINDLTSPSILAHLLKYDSVHGRFQGTISSDETSITVNDKKIDVSSIRSPIDLPWASLNVDVVIESTGIFTSATSAKGGYNDHLTAGAKKVILTVPAKDEIKTVVLGVNTDEISEDINVYSNASCTTNCLATGEEHRKQRKQTHLCDLCMFVWLWGLILSIYDGIVDLFNVFAYIPFIRKLTLSLFEL